MSTREPGYLEGETCGRKACVGVIECHPVQGCYCHISAPCSACTAPRNYCPVCGWEEADEEVEPASIVEAMINHPRLYEAPAPRPLDPTKIDYRIKSHSNSSQICEGVYPDGTTRAQVLARVEGTFGGRFEHFGGGKFKYIAYTD